jgi:hypothetical protein
MRFNGILCASRLATRAGGGHPEEPRQGDGTGQAPAGFALRDPGRGAPRPITRGRGGPSPMNNIIYIIGAIVVVLAILSFLGLR